MRIISGEARGRKLFAPAGDATRPTSDKLRGSLFNILNAWIEDAVVLDLFGGTGALALEALSRGAERAVVCDSSKAAIDAIRRNSEAVLHNSDPSRITILKQDYRAAITSLSGLEFDLIFLDPPYRMEEAYADAIERLESKGLLAEDPMIVAERRSDVSLSIPADFEVTDTRVYGDTSVDFIRRRTEE